MSSYSEEYYPTVPPPQLPNFNVGNPTVAAPGYGAGSVVPPPARATQAEVYDVNKPTCSLNIVCYRYGSSGCKTHQIQVVRHYCASSYETHLSNDRDLFLELQNVYSHVMCNFWRRHFFLKQLRGIRLLVITTNSRPYVAFLDDSALQEILFAYQNPYKITTEHDWIDWVFDLRQQDRRHALEFVEGWNKIRITIAGTVPIVLSIVVGFFWSVVGDVQTAFTVSGFILTAGSLGVALLAVISGIKDSGSGNI